jgi:O-acetyl-ADP-ribose deacetylase (regulator of RNase III)
MREPLLLKIVQGSILETETQAIVKAANSLGIMGGAIGGDSLSIAHSLSPLA